MGTPISGSNSSSGTHSPRDSTFYQFYGRAVTQIGPDTEVGEGVLFIDPSINPKYCTAAPTLPLDFTPYEPAETCQHSWVVLAAVSVTTLLVIGVALHLRLSGKVDRG